MTVKFTAAHTQGALYNKDDVAGFEPDIEKYLVETLKVAEKVPAAKTPAAKA